jgi:hypothetical protein
MPNSLHSVADMLQDQKLSALRPYITLIDQCFSEWWKSHGMYATAGEDVRETARLAWLAGWLTGGTGDERSDCD